MALFPAGPQPPAPDGSVPLQNRQLRTAVFPVGPQPPALDGSVPHRTLSASQKICQIECQSECQKRCQKECQKNMPKRMPDYTSDRVSEDMPEKMPNASIYARKLCQTEVSWWGAPEVAQLVKSGTTRPLRLQGCWTLNQANCNILQRHTRALRSECKRGMPSMFVLRLVEKQAMARKVFQSCCCVAKPCQVYNRCIQGINMPALPAPSITSLMHWTGPSVLRPLLRVIASLCLF